MFDKVKMGLDPEIILCSTENLMVSANQIIPQGQEKFGLDGCSSIAEIRPEPSESIEKLVLNIYRALKEGKKNGTLKNLAWYSGSYHFNHPIGGHIHIGGLTDKEIPKVSSLLDVYLAPLFLLLEKKEKFQARIHGSYGHLGDTRTQSYKNGEFGLEYRTPPSFILSPKIAYSVLKFAQEIVLAYKKESKEVIMNSNRLVCGEFCNMFNDANKIWFLNNWYQEHKKISYEMKWSFLNNLYKIIDSKRCWQSSVDIKQEWKIGEGVIAKTKEDRVYDIPPLNPFDVPPLPEDRY